MDATKINRTAHSIKGASLTMRFNLLAKIAGRIEYATSNNSLENIESLLKELREEWDIVKTILMHKIKQ
ncbi:MAG: Hpt domain-containing protein [Leptospiraceae bacterium]|nr:Hpt domain-containing protein [Leptospiraceae bacterium]